MSDDYKDFAISTAQQIANEETDKLYAKEFGDDCQELMQSWAARLSDRIDSRMTALGIAQALVIVVTWEPENLPEFHFTGATDIGASEEQS